jgi:hypothetical protein
LSLSSLLTGHIYIRCDAAYPGSFGREGESGDSPELAVGTVAGRAKNAICDRNEQAAKRWVHLWGEKPEPELAETFQHKGVARSKHK